MGFISTLMLKRVLIAAVCVLFSSNLFAEGLEAPRPERRKIIDNSFLLEEAYNQPYGVVQHIQIFALEENYTWAYYFFQEWPVPDEKNQISYAVPVLHGGGDGTGLGDVALEYRYQLFLKKRFAMAPAFAVSFPTGDYKKGMGYGTYGFELRIPVSIDLSDYFVTHLNAAAVFIPQKKGPLGGDANAWGHNLSGSLVWLALEDFNFLVEALWTSNVIVFPDENTDREHFVFINPGFRCAINFKSGMQIVPGISAPIGLGPSSGNYGVLFYLSIEHKVF